MESFNYILGSEWENLQTILGEKYDEGKQYRVHTSKSDVCYTIKNSVPGSEVYGAECEGQSDIYVDEGVAPNFYLKTMGFRNTLEISEVE